MAASQGASAVGVQFQRGDGTSSETFTTLNELKSINGPPTTRTMVDLTNLNSDNGYKEKAPDFKDGGQISCTFNFTEVVYGALSVDFASSSSVNYKILLPAALGSGNFTFAAYVTSLSMTFQMGSAVEINVTFDITGAVTFASS